MRAPQERSRFLGRILYIDLHNANGLGARCANDYCLDDADTARNLFIYDLNYKCCGYYVYLWNCNVDVCYTYIRSARVFLFLCALQTEHVFSTMVHSLVSFIPQQVYQWINELSNPDTRETALLELSKKRESVPDLAPMLWHSFGTTAALLQEIINIYPTINPATLTAHQSNRVCNALALLQCVASHPETRTVFLQAQIPLFLYPFLHTTSKTRPFEYLRLTSLGVIGALVKVSVDIRTPIRLAGRKV